MVDNNNHLLQQARRFFEFEIDDKICPLEDIINASIDLLKYLPYTRINVLKFYNILFHEYCHQYCLMNTQQPLDTAKPINSAIGDGRFPVLMKFVRALNVGMNNNNNRQPNNRMQKKKKSTDSVNGNSDIQSSIAEPSEVEDCPQSPSTEQQTDFDMEDLSSSALGCNSIQNELILILNLLDKQMIHVSETLSNLLKSDNENGSIVIISISDWALDLAAQISYKYHAFIDKDNGLADFSLVKTLGFWNQCCAMQVLFKIILDSIDKIEATTLINRIMKFSPHSDWILAKMFTGMSQSEYVRKYIEELIISSSFSAIHILSHVSEHNPYAIMNCSKSNISFLLKLCANSKTLLDLLAHDIIKNPDFDTLNKMAETQSKFSSTRLDELNKDILFCILNAPNAFLLLKISFELVIYPKSSTILVNRILNLLSLLVKELHQYIYECFSPPKNHMHSLLVMLRENIHKIIVDQSMNKSKALKRIQSRLLSLTCIYFGTEFITEVFHHLMNVPPHQNNIDVSNYRNVKMNNMISSLLISLRLHIGYDVFGCVKNTLQLHYVKKLSFWFNMVSLIENQRSLIVLDLERLIFFLNQKTSISTENVEDLFKIYYILRIFITTSDEYGRRPQYLFCFTLVSTYFYLMESMQTCPKNSYLTLIMDGLVICQKLLENLAHSSFINEYIIGQTLLDFVHEKNHLFLEQYPKPNNEQTMVINQTNISLLSKNMNNNFKYKKNPLVPSFSKRICIQNPSSTLNRKLFYDLFRICIDNKIWFSEAFVDSFSNQLIPKDAPWLDEDPKDGKIPHLRMTFETDLHIYRMFCDNPVLWDIMEFLSKNRCLSHCLVFIKCIANVLRTNLMSSTPNIKHASLTKRFISMLANDEILPILPFIHIAAIVEERMKSTEMAYLLHDIVKYIRDNTESSDGPISIKPYLNRLRIILAHQEPGDFYLKIFKSIS